MHNGGDRVQEEVEILKKYKHCQRRYDAKAEDRFMMGVLGGKI